MPLRFSRRLFLLHLFGLTVAGCKQTPNFEGTLSIGVINYGGGEQIINQFDKFNRYLGEKTKAYIQLEPTFNENKAIESLEARRWSLVFAPPGLAAIAIARYQYIPLFPLLGVSNLRSILIVRKDNPIKDLKQLQGETVALGQPGSTTGYYLPLFNLYGLTLTEVLFAPTPKTVMEWVTQGKVTAGAVSIAEFNETSPPDLRILYTDPHYTPPGAVLIGTNVESNRQEYIRQVMSEFPSVLAEEIGYIPNGRVPDYRYLITVVERVKLISSQLKNKPARLF